MAKIMFKNNAIAKIDKSSVVESTLYNISFILSGTHLLFKCGYVKGLPSNTELQTEGTVITIQTKRSDCSVILPVCANSLFYLPSLLQQLFFKKQKKEHRLNSVLFS